ncbi:MAG: SRPBCC family protein [Gammaproteobacteria bacterium]
MSKEIKTEIEISAPADTIWRELINFDAYPTWNPFIQYITGNLSQGGHLSVLVCPPNNKDMRFNPVVRELVENKKLVWLGRLLFPGVFDGEHCFELTPLSKNTTRFVHKEKFSGALVPLFWSSMEQDTRQGFISMNQALKARCEAG